MGRHGTIAGRKAKQDSKRAAMFTKYSRAITVAARNGGGDLDYNVELKHAVERARGINMPNDNLERAIKKGTGDLEGQSYEPGSFEGYGPSGVAFIVEVLTDNKNRTSSAIKHAFDKNGGNLGTPGCVSYMFSRKGYVLIEKTDDLNEDVLMEIALENGMEDMEDYEDSIGIITEPEDFNTLTAAIREAGYIPVEADIEYLSSIESEPKEEDIHKLQKLIEMLEENDDVQKVHHNSAIPIEE